MMFNVFHCFDFLKNIMIFSIPATDSQSLVVVLELTRINYGHATL